MVYLFFYNLSLRLIVLLVLKAFSFNFILSHYHYNILSTNLIQIFLASYFPTFHRLDINYIINMQD
jgi:hypothetical protein